MTEFELVDRCRKGNRDAQHMLYVQTSERIYQLLVRMTGSRDTAFDLAQETYLRAFAHIAQFDGRSSVATWLYRIAVTQALQFLRRSKRTRGPLSGDLEPPAESGTPRSDIRLDVNDALARLDPGDRSLLLLRYQQGLDYRVISQVLDCKEGTVASRLNRARERLRKYLGKSYAPREGMQAPGHPKHRKPGGSPTLSAANTRWPGRPNPEEPSREL
ncbi:MAG: RNA polymerase sigma factor [Phycisphaerae bacterium]